jgi:hypothetical protein
MGAAYICDYSIIADVSRELCSRRVLERPPLRLKPSRLVGHTVEGAGLRRATCTEGHAFACGCRAGDLSHPPSFHDGGCEPEFLQSKNSAGSGRRPFSLYGNSGRCRAYAVLHVRRDTLARAAVGRGTAYICDYSIIADVSRELCSRRVLERPCPNSPSVAN